MSAPLIHLVRQSTINNPPLLLLLHGVGSNEEDLFSLADEFDAQWLVLSLRAPFTRSVGSYAWFTVDMSGGNFVIDADQAEKSRLRLLQFVDWAVEDYGANASKVVLVGFSQGAVMSASVALTEPEKITGAVLMSGRILPEVLPKVAPQERQKTKFLVVHGTQDQVIAVDQGRASRETLRSVGIEPDYHEFTMPHTVSDASLAVVTRWVDALV